ETSFRRKRAPTISRGRDSSQSCVVQCPSKDWLESLPLEMVGARFRRNEVSSFRSLRLRQTLADFEIRVVGRSKGARRMTNDFEAANFKSPSSSNRGSEPIFTGWFGR